MEGTEGQIRSLLYATEMGTYTPGNNDVESTTVEGYDELIHRQVY